MRILHILDVSIPMLAGYTTRSRYITDAQRAMGWEPVVLTTARQENPQGLTAEEIDGVRYHRSISPAASSLRGTLGRLPVIGIGAEGDGLRRRIIEVARAEKPDLIHAHSSVLCGIPAYLASRRLSLPCVYEIRSFWEDAAVDLGRTKEGSLRYRTTRSAETGLARRVDAVVPICNGIRADIEARGIPGERLYVVPNGVDTERFVPLRRNDELAEKHGLEGKTVVSYIGTFAPFEGVPALVTALVELIRAGREDLRGLIVGKGQTYEDCRRIARDAGLEEKIVHPGRVPHDEVQSYYSITDILVYPRVRQRMTELVTPLKPLEAMAMGKAVIGSDVGGLAELITHGETGLLFEAEHPEALRSAIVDLADDRELRTRLGRQGRDHVCRHRRWHDIVSGYRAVYDDACRRHDRGTSRAQA